MAAGWNMISLPVTPASASVSDLFVNAIDNTLFGFDTTYKLVSDGQIQTGTGYWLRNSADETVTVSGLPVESMNLSLSAGWNMIGGPNCSALQSSWTDTDNIILSGTLFGFDTTYKLVSQMDPGKGYWIRTSQAGEVTVSCSASKNAPVSTPVIAGYELIITDASGQRAQLFLGPMSDEREGAYTLPPAAAGTALRASFDGDRYVSSNAGDWIRINGASGPIKVTSNGELITRLQVRDVTGVVLERQVNASGHFELRSGEEAVRIVDGIGTELPKVFALRGNYPNPFNPVTNLSLDLPEMADVSVTVFDVLGRQVMHITQEAVSAGTGRNIRIDASSLASGQYFYYVRARMESGFRAASGNFALLK